jgi:hypothetical protein
MIGKRNLLNIFFRLPGLLTSTWPDPVRWRGVMAPTALVIGLPYLVQAQQTPASAVVQTKNSVATADPNMRFYRKYAIQPIGNGEKVLITLDGDDGKQYNIVAEPVAPKEGGAVTQYVFYSAAGGALYTKTTVAPPDSNGSGSTPVEGISVTWLPGSSGGSQQAAPARSAIHQSSSIYTTVPRHDRDFKIPIRFDKPGFGMGRPRLWIIWDGQHEIQVEPVQTKFRGLKDYMPIANLEEWLSGNLNHLKIMSNVYTEGSPAPRYFYMRKNPDDSITIYGDDDISKLKAKEKGKN